MIIDKRHKAVVKERRIQYSPFFVLSGIKNYQLRLNCSIKEKELC